MSDSQQASKELDEIFFSTSGPCTWWRCGARLVTQGGHQFRESVVQHSRDGVHWSDAVDESRLVGENDALHAELAVVRASCRDFEEREAACCPEDVPFDEYIKALTGRLARIKSLLREEIERVDEMHNRPLDESGARLVCAGCCPICDWLSKSRGFLAATSERRRGDHE